MSHIRIIGYSADDEPIRTIQKFVQKTKKQNQSEKRQQLYQLSSIGMCQWYCYLIDGERRYYSAEQNIVNLHKLHNNVQLLEAFPPIKTKFDKGDGFGFDGPIIPMSQSVVIPLKNPKPTRSVIISPFKRITLPQPVPNFKSKYVNGKPPHCCYCNLELTSDNYTKDHVIPKHKGGKETIPCCYACNQEKGGLMLHSYIQFLNLLLADMKTGSKEYLLTQIKIVNANEIAKSLAHTPPPNARQL